MNNSNYNTSLNDAFELILKIFNDERLCYENTINSLKDKVSELEDSLIQVKNENKTYQTKISKLKGKLKSISKTVSKLEDDDFSPKPNKKNNKNINENEELNGININKNNFTVMKCRNDDKNNDIFNSFRYKSKIMQDNNKSTSINNNFIKMKNLDNDKLKNNGEDINRTNYIKKHKKTLSTKLKNSILNNIHESHLKKRNEDNTMIRSHYFNDEDDSLFLGHNSNENDSQNKNTILLEDKKMKVQRKINIGRDKYNKINQKIRGLKSALSFYNKHDLLNSTENYNSINS